MDISKKAINKRFIKSINDFLDGHPHLSKKEVADSLGLKQNTFSEILSGRMGVGTDILSKSYLIYKIDVIWILTGSMASNEYLYPTNEDLMIVSENDENQYKSLDVDGYKILIDRVIEENKFIKKQNSKLLTTIEDQKLLIDGFTSGRIVIANPADKE